MAAARARASSASHYRFLPDQLFPPALLPPDVATYEAIVPARYLRRGFSAVKVAWLLATMRAYEAELRAVGLRPAPAPAGAPVVVFAHPEDPPELGGGARARPSPAFLLTDEEAVDAFRASRRRAGWQTAFYRRMRARTGLLGGADRPEGGRLTYDVENRAPWDASVPLPRAYDADADADAEDAEDAACWEWAWAEARRRDPAGRRWVWRDPHPRPFPATRAGWRRRLAAFVAERLSGFGRFQDAIVVGEPEMFHSVLSPGMNAGLLPPAEVLRAAAAAAAPLAAREGFVRQVLGWREFARAAHVADARLAAADYNALGATARLPRGRWTRPDTGVPPLDDAIRDVWARGHLDHIRRLMVVANAMQLRAIAPREMRAWFLAATADAYPWVMSFNVVAMGAWASAGEGHTTKPYVTGSAYLARMARLPDGRRAYRRSEPWARDWDARYRAYLARHARLLRRHAPRVFLPRSSTRA